MDFWGNSHRRQLNLDLDLNYPSPPLDLSLGLSNFSNASGYNFQQVQALNAAALETPNDGYGLALISSRAFAEARENSERNHSHGKRARLHESTGMLRGSAAVATLCTNCKARIPDPCDKKDRIQESSVSAPSPEEPIFSCSICLDHLTEPTSTRCGHIFCKECLVKSLKSLQNRCPICRQKVGKRGIFRVYLPTTN